MYISKKVLALFAGVALAGAVVGVLAFQLVATAGALERANAEIRKGNETIGFLNEQVTQGNATIESLNGEVLKANEVNTSLNAEVTKGNETIASLNGQVAKGNETIAGFVESNEAWQTQFNILDVTHRSLQTQHGRLQGQYDTLNSNHRALQSSHTALQVRHDDVKEDLAASRWELRETKEDLAAANSNLAAAQDILRGRGGEVANLTQRVMAQENRIRELLGERAPLLLNYANSARSGFLCTGSMDPTITCLDEMTWLEDFHPADVVVGAVISFTPPDRGKDEPPTAHRVMAIKVDNGVHYFWPKGDNNPEADGYWIPEYDVGSYLVRIHRNVRPANAELRRLVNAAKEAHNEAHAAYYALRDQHCPNREETCTAPTTAVYERLVVLREALIVAWEHFDCWQQVAIDSQYPGHIPRRC